MPAASEAWLHANVETEATGATPPWSSGSSRSMISDAAADGRHRQSAADRLAHRGQVGRHAVVGLRAAVGDREGDHLVEDQDDAEARGDVAQPLEVLRRGGDHPGGALHGLDQDGGDALVLALEDLLGAVGVVERDLEELPGDAAGRRRRARGRARCRRSSCRRP